MRASLTRPDVFGPLSVDRLSVTHCSLGSFTSSLIFSDVTWRRAGGVLRRLCSFFSSDRELSTPEIRGCSTQSFQDTLSRSSVISVYRTRPSAKLGF